MDDNISRAFVLSGLDALRPVKPKGPESVMETVNKSAWDCALNCAEAVVRTAPPQVPEIVRCKDCKYRYETEHNGKRMMVCDYMDCQMGDEDFCSKGERNVRNP